MVAACALTGAFWAAARVPSGRVRSTAPMVTERRMVRSMVSIIQELGCSTPVVPELERAAEIVFPELPHGFLKLILGGGRDPHLVRHDRGLDLLQLVVL